MNQKALVSDLARLEEMTTDTNLLIHIARIRKRAENGFYHLQAGTIRNPPGRLSAGGPEYPAASYMHAMSMPPTRRSYPHRTRSAGVRR